MTQHQTDSVIMVLMYFSVNTGMMVTYWNDMRKLSIMRRIIWHIAILFLGLPLAGVVMLSSIACPEKSESS